MLCQASTPQVWDCLLPAAVRGDVEIDDDVLDEHDDDEYTNASSEYSDKESAGSGSKTTATPQRGDNEVIDLVDAVDDGGDYNRSMGQVPGRVLPRQESEMSEGQKNRAFLQKFTSDNSNNTNNNNNNNNNNSGRSRSSRSIYMNSTSSAGNLPVFSFLSKRSDHRYIDPLSVEPKTKTVFPPPAYFEIHDIPRVPTQIETPFDDGWLPRPPSILR